MRKLFWVFFGGAAVGVIGAKIQSRRQERVAGTPGIGKLYDSKKIYTGGAVDMWWSSKQEIGKAMRMWVNNDRHVNMFRKLKNNTDSAVEYFNLLGIEFGNWMNQQDRLEHYLGSISGFRDMSVVLGVKNVQIGLGGTLGLALGARGIGGSKAHYHPGYPYINMNKRNGANSLAHEYGHALDFYMGKKYHNRKLHSVAGGRSVRRKTDEIILAKAAKSSPEYLFEKLFDTLFFEKGKPTQFYELMGDAGKYWGSRVEIWARVFEAWMYYRMKEKGLTNIYLTKQSYKAGVYPPKRLIDKTDPWIRKIIKVAYK